MPSTEADRELVRRIRTGDESAWMECISLFEGRLIAFVRSRLGDHATAEDVVQETFIGFLTALPNFDDKTPIDSFLFAIASYKLTDVLRKNGRRPTLPLAADRSDGNAFEPAGSARMASSIARSVERHRKEETIIANCLKDLISRWFTNAEFERLKCAELLFVQGLQNKEVAAVLNLTEQDVANHKYYIVNKLKEAGRTSLAEDFDWDLIRLDESSAGDEIPSAET